MIKHEQGHDNSPRSLRNGGMQRAGLNDCTRKLREMSRQSTGPRWKSIPTSSNGWIAETLGAKAGEPSSLVVGLVMMLRSWHTEALRWSHVSLACSRKKGRFS